MASCRFISLARAGFFRDNLSKNAGLRGRERLKRPDQTLRNAHMLGLLNKGDEPGTFCVNTVGENLVAMTLPGDGTAPQRRAKKTPANRAAKAPVKKAVAKRGPGKKA